MYTYKIYHDNKLQKTFENQPNDICIFGYMLRAQSNSINHALKYEGWRIEITNEETGETEKMKPYF